MLSKSARIPATRFFSTRAPFTELTPSTLKSAKELSGQLTTVVQNNKPPAMRVFKPADTAVKVADVKAEEAPAVKHIFAPNGC